MNAVGIDLVSVKRMRSLISNHGGRLIDTIFNSRDFEDLPMPASALEGLSSRNLDRMSRSLALKFAAKEAAIKALAVPLRNTFEFGDIAVHGLSRLEVQLQGPLSSLAKSRMILRLIGSGSVTAGHAMAIIIGEGYD